VSPSPNAAALAALRRRLGLGRLLCVGLRVAWAGARGQPFGHLPRATDARERQSRAQIGPAILLHRALIATGTEAREAFAITRDVVLAAGAAFLAQTLGPLRRADLEGLDAAGRRAFADSRGRRFFNATLTWDAIEPDHVGFTVTACRFPELCAAVGAADLAPLFCDVDEAYFGTVEPDVVLTRSTTIARGGATCPFTLRWK
jgi:hypothetical protein